MKQTIIRTIFVMAVLVFFLPYQVARSQNIENKSVKYIGNKGYKLSIMGRVPYQSTKDYSAKFILNHVDLMAQEQGGIEIVTDNNGQHLAKADFAVRYVQYLVDLEKCLNANDIQIVQLLTKKEFNLTSEEEKELNSVWAKTIYCKAILVGPIGGSNLSATVEDGHLMLSGEIKTITFDPKFQRKGGTRVAEDSRFIIFEVSEVTHKLRGLSLSFDSRKK